MPPIERKKIDLEPLIKAKVPVIFIVGGPGSGKGTQCVKIREKFGLSHLSSGDLLRDEVQSGSERGQSMQKMMAEGELVPLEVVLDLIKEAMLKEVEKGTKGFLLDGYPRETRQGEMFEKEIMECAAVVYFHVSDEIMTERIMGRGLTSGRVDDNVEAIKKRLNTYKSSTIPVLDYYRAKNKVIEVNAEAGIDEVFGRVLPPLEKVLTPA